MKCYDKSNEYFRAIESVLGYEIAYYVMVKNNGYPLDRTPDGERSQLWQDLVDAYGEINAIKIKAKTYLPSFIESFGDWINENLPNTYETGEPKLSITPKEDVVKKKILPEKVERVRVSPKKIDETFIKTVDNEYVTSAFKTLFTEIYGQRKDYLYFEFEDEIYSDIITSKLTNSDILKVTGHLLFYPVVKLMLENKIVFTDDKLEIKTGDKDKVLKYIDEHLTEDEIGDIMLSVLINDKMKITNYFAGSLNEIKEFENPKVFLYNFGDLKAYDVVIKNDKAYAKLSDNSLIQLTEEQIKYVFPENKVKSIPYEITDGLLSIMEKLSDYTDVEMYSNYNNVKINISLKDNELYVNFNGETKVFKDPNIAFNEIDQYMSQYKLNFFWINYKNNTERYIVSKTQKLAALKALSERFTNKALNDLLPQSIEKDIENLLQYDVIKDHVKLEDIINLPIEDIVTFFTVNRTPIVGPDERILYKVNFDFIDVDNIQEKYFETYEEALKYSKESLYKIHEDIMQWKLDETMKNIDRLYNILKPFEVLNNSALEYLYTHKVTDKIVKDTLEQYGYDDTLSNVTDISKSIAIVSVAEYGVDKFFSDLGLDKNNNVRIGALELRKVNDVYLIDHVIVGISGEELGTEFEFESNNKLDFLSEVLLQLNKYAYETLPGSVKTFVYENAEYEAGMSLIESVKNILGVKYGTDQMYRLGYGFYHYIGAFADINPIETVLNFVNIVENAYNTGSEIKLSTTIIQDKLAKEYKYNKNGIYFEIMPDQDDILFVGLNDLSTGVLGTAPKFLSVLKKEYAGVAFQKSPEFNIMNDLLTRLDVFSIFPGNETIIKVKPGNFVIKYTEEFKKENPAIANMIDRMNKKLEYKYGKPERKYFKNTYRGNAKSFEEALKKLYGIGDVGEYSEIDSKLVAVRHTINTYRQLYNNIKTLDKNYETLSGNMAIFIDRVVDNTDSTFLTKIEADAVNISKFYISYYDKIEKLKQICKV